MLQPTLISRKRSNSWNNGAVSSMHMNSAQNTHLLTIPTLNIERSASLECVNGLSSPIPIPAERSPSWDFGYYKPYNMPTPTHDPFSSVQTIKIEYFQNNSKSLPSHFRNIPVSELYKQYSNNSNTNNSSNNTSISDYGRQDYPEISIDDTGEDNFRVRNIMEEVIRQHVEECEAYLTQQCIPLSPYDWNTDHVRNFVYWCNDKFDLKTDMQRFYRYNGVRLCNICEEEFIYLIGNNSDNRWQIMQQVLFALQKRHRSCNDLHNLLKCSEITINQTRPIPPKLVIPEDNSPIPSPEPTNLTPNLLYLDPLPRMNFPILGSKECYSPLVRSPLSTPLSTPGHSPQLSPMHSPCPSPTLNPLPSHSTSTGCGPIQLWQFLLELLLDPKCQPYIQWTDKEWEFKLVNPEEVAKKWGQRKNKPKMNYEKLSRGLRYYYDKHIIHKVPGKRYVYKFVCDVQRQIGLSFEELILKRKAECYDIEHSTMNSHSPGPPTIKLNCHNFSQLMPQIPPNFLPLSPNHNHILQTPDSMFSNMSLSPLPSPFSPAPLLSPIYPHQIIPGVPFHS